MKGFILSAKHIDFFRQLGKVVGVGRWVGIHRGGMIHMCTRFFGRWTGGKLELLFGRHSVKGILTRSNPNIRIFDDESWISQTIRVHRFVESNPRFVLEYSNI